MALKKKSPTKNNDERILEACLDMAEEQGWSNVRLSQIAKKLKLTLVEVEQHFRDLDAVANAWFEQALVAMLVKKPPAFARLPAPERLHMALSLWLDALSPRRAVTAQMIAGKMHLPHVHHWFPMIISLSRLVHWWLDAAAITSTGRQRQMAEVGLSAILLATLAVWSRDESQDQVKTTKFLEKRLSRADCFMSGMWIKRRRERSEQG